MKKPVYKRIIYSVLLLSPLFTSCTKSPEALAKEYCKCKAEKTTGNDCASLAESHYLQLQDEPELLQRYTLAVTDCIINPTAK